MSKTSTGVSLAHEAFTKDLNSDKDFIEFKERCTKNRYHTVKVQSGFEIDKCPNSGVIVKTFAYER